jgi:hypothetical protein
MGWVGGHARAAQVGVRAPASGCATLLLLSIHHHSILAPTTHSSRLCVGAGVPSTGGHGTANGMPRTTPQGRPPSPLPLLCCGTSAACRTSGLYTSLLAARARIAARLAASARRACHRRKTLHRPKQQQSANMETSAKSSKGTALVWWYWWCTSLLAPGPAWPGAVLLLSRIASGCYVMARAVAYCKGRREERLSTD